MLDIIYALVPCAIFILVVLNVIKNTNYAKKGFWLIVSGLFFALLWLIGYIIDKSYEIAILGSIFYYIPLMSTALVLVVVGIVLLIKGKQLNLHVFNYGSVDHSDTDQFLYIVFKYNGFYYLVKHDEKYSGALVKFYRGIYFYDDMLSEFVKKSNISVSSEKLVGTATKFKRRKKIVYNCFLIEVNSLEGLDNLVPFDPFAIANADMLESDKTMVMSILIGENFNIEIK